jgi:hypothetical protein
MHIRIHSFKTKWSNRGWWNNNKSEHMWNKKHTWTTPKFPTGKSRGQRILPIVAFHRLYLFWDVRLCSHHPRRVIKTRNYKYHSLRVLTRIILNRIIQNTVERHLRKEQASFRKHRSSVDLINTLRIIPEQSVVWQAILHVIFIDFEKAFDSVYQGRSSK